MLRKVQYLPIIHCFCYFVYGKKHSAKHFVFCSIEERNLYTSFWVDCSLNLFVMRTQGILIWNDLN